MAYPKTKAGETYDRILAIDGRHPFKDHVPGAFVDYAARKRKNGKVVYFNFALAKEMGLIPKNHPEKLNRSLHTALLDAFAIQIINEYDIINNVKVPKSEMKDYHYMATRYLQLQHPNKTGLTSGDGRSIWNGYTTHRGVTWDISSCGTGATCLSPATAINKRFFKTGDPAVSYGCGYSEVLEGIGDAIFSEVLHLNNVRSERCLAIIEFEKGLSINVRAGKNLLRPSHFFNHLKQENYLRLKCAVDFFINRQVQNRDFDKKECAKDPYNYLLDYTCEIFADVCAKFESDYIFCWLDWDGDNILADGGIIDYGSIRQFGMFHHEYRFDDVERWSTTITEQKNKARYIVQTYAQMISYLKTKKKRPLRTFARHKILKKFDRRFLYLKQLYLLERIGFNREQAEALLTKHKKAVVNFEKIFTHFERATSTKGLIRVEDGITKNAVFCLRDILRELPVHLYHNECEFMGPKEFVDVMASDYATRNDLKVTAPRRQKIRNFQKAYLDLVKKAGTLQKSTREKILAQVIKRTQLINRYERVTGDGVIHIVDRVNRSKKVLSSEELQQLIREFIHRQVLDPDKKKPAAEKKLPGKMDRIMHSMFRILKEHREGL